jgi:hypothetical protein
MGNDDCFVQPDIVRITLSDGKYIDIKKELTAYEYRSVFAGLVKDMRAGEKITLDPEKVGITKVMAYLLGWSFTNKGQPVEISEGAVNNLHRDIYAEISKAIDTHEEQIEAEREARKNEKAGTPPSAAISA